MRFSQRIGKTPVKVELEREGISDELRNRLWNRVEQHIDDLKGYGDFTEYCKRLWDEFYGLTTDSLPRYNTGSVAEELVIKALKVKFFGASWFEQFDLVEFVIQNNGEHLVEDLNGLLKAEMSAYRIVNFQIVEIHSEEEILEIESALQNTDPMQSVRTHLETALTLLSDRKNPDYRNSIKESISAIEAIGRIYLDDKNLTMGKTLAALKKRENIPENLMQALQKMYDFTNQDNGSRHALNADSYTATMEDARFYLVACSAFTNYLIHKMN